MKLKDSEIKNEILSILAKLSSEHSWSIFCFPKEEFPSRNDDNGVIKFEIKAGLNYKIYNSRPTFQPISLQLYFSIDLDIVNDERRKYLLETYYPLSKKDLIDFMKNRWNVLIPYITPFNNKDENDNKIIALLLFRFRGYIVSNEFNF